jgi:pimeloyl-ACP methyl ester carboxylesterase
MNRNPIASRKATIEGVKLHYLTAGDGPTLILLHGYTQTSRMWKPIIPTLAEKFSVIAPDLPGIGDSAIPKDGLDMKTAASRIHALAKSLGVEKARVVGHDIGLMVAYAYAAQFPAETAAYTKAYAHPGRMRSGWAHFVSFGQAAKDFAELSQIKLTMPVLAIGGEKASGEVLGQQTRIVASDATVVVLKNTGHWVLEENPKGTTDALMNFL